LFLSIVITQQKVNMLDILGRVTIKTLITRLIATGIYPDASASEEKKIKLTNGILLIMGAYLLVLGVAMMIGEYCIAGALTYSLSTGLVVMGLGFVSIFYIQLTRLRWYIFFKCIILIVFWVTVVVMSVLFGKIVRIDQYLLVTLLLPFAFFDRPLRVWSTVGVSILLYLTVNMYYYKYPPLIDLPIREARLWYLMHSTMMVMAIVSFVSYLQRKNRVQELALSIKIEEHKHIMQDLKESNRAKDKFFSVIAHDLQGPVGNFAHILSYYENATMPDELYESMRLAANNTFCLLEDLLLWARSQKQHVEYHPVDFEIHPLLTRMQEFYQFQAQEKGIQIEIPHFDSKEFVYADPSTVNIVLRNLVGNAIKFTPSGGKIFLYTEPHSKPGMVKVFVRDTGMGMSTEKQHQLFQLGRSSISTAGTNNEKGSGLGLLLCQEFVRGNRGEIGVESKLGEGSCFYFTIPQGIPGEEPALRNKINELNLHVLVVEDNVLNLKTTMNTLDDLGITYVVSRDGEDAVRKATAQRYDLILLDITLPFYNGVVVNRKVRAQYPDARIIALSSYSKLEIQEMDTEVRFDYYLKKPLDQEELTACIRRSNFTSAKAC